MTSACLRVRVRKYVRFPKVESFQTCFLLRDLLLGDINLLEFMRSPLFSTSFVAGLESKISKEMAYVVVF